MQPNNISKSVETEAIVTLQVSSPPIFLPLSSSPLPLLPPLPPQTMLLGRPSDQGSQSGWDRQDPVLDPPISECQMCRPHLNKERKKEKKNHQLV